MLHAHLADDNVAIDTLAGSVDFWQQCFKAGIGHLVYQDLLRFGRMTDILKDTVLFLSAHHHEFMQSPELVVQRAYDTPKSSIFSRQLRKAGVKVRVDSGCAISSTPLHGWAACRTCRAVLLPLRRLSIGCWCWQVPGRVLSKPSGWSAEQFSIGNLEGVLWCVAISPDGMILALGTGDHKVLLCEARSGIQLAALEGHTEAVMHVTYSHDGRRLASGSCDGTARLWDAGGGVRIATLRGHNGPVTSCSFSPSGRFLATGGVDCTVRVWDIEEESDCLQVAELKGHSKWVATVAYGPYGNVIVSGGNDGRVVVWDAATWVLRSTIDNISHAVYSLALTPDESTVAIGCEDGVLRLWSLISMKQVREVEVRLMRTCRLVALPASTRSCRCPVASRCRAAPA